jgi:DNA repair exonuclease SbcCD ATPase subunit
MSLLFATLQEFTLFLKIVLWIAVPLTVIALTIATILHYRRKRIRGNAVDPDPVEQLSESGLMALHSDAEARPSATDTETLNAEAVPDWLASADPANKSLLKKYEHEIRYFREKNHSLEEDFRRLEDKYETLMAKAYRGDKPGNEQILTELRNENRDYKKQIDQLRQQLEELKTNPPADKHESPYMTGSSAVSPEQDAAAPAEQNYLRDLVEEEKLHISFLQQQLDQRIRSFHEMEHQLNEAVANLEKAHTDLSETRDQLSTAEEMIEAKNMETEQQRKIIEGYLDQIRQRDETIGAKTEYITHLEKSIAELQAHHNHSLHLLNATSNEVSELNDQLSARSEQILDLQTRLEENNRFLARLKEQIVTAIDNEETVQPEAEPARGQETILQPQASFS